MIVIHTVLSKCGRRASIASDARTQRAETLICKQHILFIVQACLTGKILNLACQHHESHPNCDLIA